MTWLVHLLLLSLLLLDQFTMYFIRCLFCWLAKYCSSCVCGILQVYQHPRCGQCCPETSRGQSPKNVEDWSVIFVMIACSLFLLSYFCLVGNLAWHPDFTRGRIMFVNGVWNRVHERKKKDFFFNVSHTQLKIEFAKCRHKIMEEREGEPAEGGTRKESNHDCVLKYYTQCSLCSWCARRCWRQTKKGNRSQLWCKQC